jgi:hypothetical protein
LWLNSGNPVVFDPDLNIQHPRKGIALRIIRGSPGGRKIC